MERDKIRVAHSHGGKLERCFDIVSSELWPGFDELSNVSPSAILPTMILTGTREPLIHGSP